MTELKRVLGLPMLTFYGTGMILGAGIYTVIGKAAGVAGESIWLSLIFAAISAALSALSYAELASMFPSVGGVYVYLSEAFPKSKWISNSSGLMMSLAGVATSAAVALAFAGYVQHFFEFSPGMIALFLLILFTGINILGIQETSWMNVVFTLIEIFGLLVFIYLGTQSPKFGEALNTMPTLATLSGSALIIFAYFGFENMVNFAEETKNPEKTLPRAILLSICITTILYVLVALAAISLLPIDQLAHSKAPLTDAVHPISSKLAGALGGIALFATANTVLIALATTSRILYGMAKKKAVPAIFGKLHPKRRTPWVADILICVLSMAILPLGRVEVLASISSFATMVAFFAVHVALIILRIQRPEIDRPFSVPFSFKRVPILPVLGGVVTFLLTLQFEKTVYVVGAVFLVIIVISQLVRKR